MKLFKVKLMICWPRIDRNLRGVVCFVKIQKVLFKHFKYDFIRDL